MLPHNSCRSLIDEEEEEGKLVVIFDIVTAAMVMVVLISNWSAAVYISIEVETGDCFKFKLSIKKIKKWNLKNTSAI